MEVRLASTVDTAGLARLLWLDHLQVEPDRPSVDAFAAELAEWWANQSATHVAFVASTPAAGIVGMAWIALVARVPRPGNPDRLSADIQSVFVHPDHRGHRVGSRLVDAAARHAENLGAARVTVHSGHRAVPMYERLRFASSRQLLQRPAE